VVGHTIEKDKVDGASEDMSKTWFSRYENEVINDPDVDMKNIYKYGRVWI